MERNAWHELSSKIKNHHIIQDVELKPTGSRLSPPKLYTRDLMGLSLQHDTPHPHHTREVELSRLRAKDTSVSTS